MGSRSRVFRRSAWPVTGRWVCTLAVLALSACRLELTDPIGLSSPRLTVFVVLTDSTPSANGAISASLWPGRDGNGTVRTPPDPTLSVAGVGLIPSEMTSDGELRYQSAWSFASDGFGGLLVDLVAPAIPGVLQAVPPTVLAPWRAGAAAVSALRGEDVALGLTAPGDTLRGVSAIWSLRVRPANLPANQGLLFQTSGGSPIQFPVVIPGGMLAGVEENQLEAELWLQQTARAEEPSGGMEVVLVVSVRVKWRITLLEAP